MKTIEEIKNEISVKYGYHSFSDALEMSVCDIGEMVNELAETYAKQCCDEQIKACVKFSAEHPYDYIKNTPNVLKV